MRTFPSAVSRYRTRTSRSAARGILPFRSHNETTCSDAPISDAKVLTGRQKPMTEIVLLFVEVESRDGHCGLGLSYSKRAGGPGQFAHAREIAPALLGEDPNDIARLWTKLCWAGASVGRSGLRRVEIGQDDPALPVDQVHQHQVRRWFALAELLVFNAVLRFQYHLAMRPFRHHAPKAPAHARMVIHDGDAELGHTGRNCIDPVLRIPDCR